ncbi:MAG: DHH family phosphoesterase [Streptococcaceae bacterium]|jgi:c-di-AMP phosphodiesterase-like protein|nr:DHH family phosphoesterase [Streptococcaceae bacterium]
MKKPTIKDILLYLSAMTLAGIAGIIILPANWMQIAWSVFIGIVLILFTWRMLKMIDIKELEMIRYTNQQAEESIKKVLDTMPLGVIRYNRETFEGIWMNPYADYVYTAEGMQIDKAVIQSILALDEQKISFLNVGEKQYYYYLYKEDGLIYFIDTTSEKLMKDEVKNRQLVIGTISVDNYDDIAETMEEKELSILNSMTTSIITDWLREHKVYSRRLNRERYFFVTRYKTLEQMIANKFDLVENFRLKMRENGTPLTLSMGIGYGMASSIEIGKISANNLEIALVRGGDQVVVKEDRESSRPQYFGGKSASVVKRTRVRTRAMGTALKGLIQEADEVYIMGHRFPDMDAIGAAFGLLHLTREYEKDGYVVLDPAQNIADVERCMQEIQTIPLLFDAIIKPKEAMMNKKENSLLIMIDYNKPSLSISQHLYREFSKVVIIDHHRRSEEFPENPLLSYIESGASSASELVTELIQFHSGRKNKLLSLEATLLMAGIVVDTKNFQMQTTSRTFDTASFLRSMGADSVKVQNLLSSDLTSYMDMNELISNNEFVTEDMIIASGVEEKQYDSVTSAKAADTILSFSGIHASFVISRRPDAKVAISSRSTNDINVQLIMEKMGGGGHFNNAAVQLEGTNVQMVRQELIEVIHANMDEIYGRKK